MLTLLFGEETGEELVTGMGQRIRKYLQMPFSPAALSHSVSIHYLRFLPPSVHTFLLPGMTPSLFLTPKPYLSIKAQFT